ncbi:TPA: hypothetical protein JG832_000895 [Enterobacter hormaechei subsp. xiangfangensis]|nr:hypothetical protein [Enterobacter hormaechei subsp. xiangfangensis]HAV1889332.1 hypothetical protein [Enterobacter hormaechei subsp. xiangfangensis]
MKITGKHESNLVLDDDLELSGMICGDLVVSDGCRADVRGMVTGRIIVEKGGILTLHGMVSNGLTNNGGDVEIFGFVTGGLNEVAGTTIIHPNSKIE